MMMLPGPAAPRWPMPPLVLELLYPGWLSSMDFLELLEAWDPDATQMWAWAMIID